MSDQTFYESREFENINHLSGEEYLDCVFENCNFEGQDLRSIQFENCEFVNCNLSNCIIEKTGFKSVDFRDCKMMGLRFDTCNPFLLEMNFKATSLNMSSFYGLDLKNTDFTDCQLVEVDLAETNLSNSNFSGTDLQSAIFDDCQLEGCDFRTAQNFQIDPSINKIKGARFARENVAGLLHHLGINFD